MKFAVAATKNGNSADMSYCSGRASIYLILEEQRNLLDSSSSLFSEMARYAGYEVSKMNAQQGVDVIIAGLFGPTMIHGLSDQGTKCATNSGSAQDAVLQLDL